MAETLARQQRLDLKLTVKC